MKKKLLAILLASMLLLSSCGNGTATSNAGTDNSEGTAQTASYEKSGNDSGTATNDNFKGDNMFDVLPEIDVTPVSYLRYHITDEFGTSIGIAVDGLWEQGITKIRLPDKIDGKPVVAVDLITENIKTLIMPETVELAYINKEILEYVNIPANITINPALIKYYEDNFLKELHGMSWSSNQFRENMLKGLYISSDRKDYLGDTDFSQFTNTKFMYKGQIYDNTNMYKIFAENPYLGLTFADNGKTVNGCNNAVREITIPEGVTCISKLKAEQIDAIHFPSTLTELGFIEGIKELIVPDTVTVLDSNSGSLNSTIESLVIGNGVTEIPEGFFRGYKTLKNLTLGKNIKTIGKSAFSGCYALENIVIPASVKEIGGFSDCSGLKTVTFEGDVETIGDSAFSGCSALENIVIPASVKEIGDSAFSGCSALENISLPDSLISLGKEAFKSCKSLENVVIPASVKEIGDSAFSGCSALENISLPDSLISLGEYAFQDCTSLEKIVIPDGVTEIMQGTFDSCKNLKDVTIGSGVKRIGINKNGSYGRAFEKCISLEYIYIPDNVEIVHRDAFGFLCYPKKLSVPKDIKVVSDYGDKSSFYYNQCEIEMRNPGASPAQTTANNDTSAPVVQTNTDSDVIGFVESVIDTDVDTAIRIITNRYPSVRFGDTYEYSTDSGNGKTKYIRYFENQFNELGAAWDWGYLIYENNICRELDFYYGKQNYTEIGIERSLSDVRKAYNTVVNNMSLLLGAAKTDSSDNYNTDDWKKNNIDIQVYFFHPSNTNLSPLLSISFIDSTYDDPQPEDISSSATENQTNNGELCAVNLLGKSISAVEKEYSVKLNLTEYGYCAETFPYTLGALEYNGEAYITTVSVYRNGKLNPDISCGIKYNDLITYCKSNNYEYFLWDDDFYYYGACVTIVMETSCAATFVWDGEMTENLESNNPPCTRIDYYVRG